MTTGVAALLGACAGVALFLGVVAAMPRRRSLAAMLAGLRAPSALEAIALPGESSRWVAELGRRTNAAAARLLLSSVPADLRLLGRTVDRHLGEKTLLAIVGALLVPAVTAAIALGGGVTIPFAIPLWGSVLMALGGFVLPDVGVRGDALARRRDVRHAFGSFLDLAIVNLAGGAGIEGAMTYAARSGKGPAFSLFRRALDVARIANVPPWEAFDQLGQEVDIEELSDFAAQMRLASVDGARVRQSLEAMASSLRGQLLADTEERDHHATVLMILAVALMVGGYLILLIYPQLERITAASP